MSNLCIKVCFSQWAKKPSNVHRDKLFTAVAVIVNSPAWKPAHLGSKAEYTPRFFVGISPIQKNSYKIGLEMGYMLPTTYEDQYSYGYGQYFRHTTLSLETKNTDLYFTFYQSLSKNSHRFIKPGVEYYQRTYHYDDSRVYFNIRKSPSVYLGTRIGFGYDFSNGIGVNLSANSRWIDSYHNDYMPKKFKVKLDAQYSF